MATTLKDIEAMTAEKLTPQQVADVIGANAQAIRIQARDNPERLGFPVIVVGHRVKIPRQAFLNFMRGTCQN